MAGDQVTNSHPAQAVGIAMLRLKSAAIKQEMGEDFMKSPTEANMSLLCVITGNQKLQRWMRVSGTTTEGLSRMIRHAK